MRYFNRNTGDVVDAVEPDPRLDALANWVRVEDGEPLPEVELGGVLSRTPTRTVPARIVTPSAPDGRDPLTPPADPSAGGDGDIYDPADHKVEDVIAYLTAADADETRRVLDAEAAGRARAGIVGQRDAILAAKPPATTEES